MYDEFMAQLAQHLQSNLPGVEAQFRAMPPGRPKPNFKEIAKTKPRQAGVLALFFKKKNQPHIVLMKRHQYPGVHSGQISLPGGQKEKIDADLVETALRETHEEIGVQREEIEILGKLSPVYIPPSHFFVQPIVGEWKSPAQFTPDAREVHSLLEVPFEEFIGAQKLISTQVNVRSQLMQVPAFQMHGEIIWGATAMMLAELAAVIEKSREK